MSDPARTTPAGRRTVTTALGLCWLAVVFDGFDLVMFGTVAPSILADEDWNVTADVVGTIAGVTLVGLLIGCLAAGRLADAFGRRRLIILCLAGFSLGMALCALATTPLQLGVFRLLTGLGLGGLLPTVNAMIAEFAPPERRRFYHALTFTAFPLGGVLAAGVGLVVVPELGWRSMFWIGASPVVLILPLLVKFLPESQEYLRVKQGRSARIDEAANLAAPDAPAHPTAFRSLFSGRYRLASLLFALAFALNFFSGFGLNTWLPRIMTGQGYSLGSALTLLLLVNLTAVVALPVLGTLSDRFGSKIVCATAFGIAAAATAVLSTSPPVGVVYAMVACAGIGTSGLTIQLNSYVAMYYPTILRGTASGWALGIGRLGAIAGPAVGGFLLANEVAPGLNFWLFALVNAVGVVVVLLVPTPWVPDRQRYQRSASRGGRPGRPPQHDLAGDDHGP